MTYVEAPFDRSIVDSVIEEFRVNPETAAIRRIAMVVAEVEKRIGCRYLRMEFGIPGIEPSPIGIEAEIGALRKPKVASSYALLTGIPQLKEEGSRFFKLFMDLEIPGEFVIPTVGAMQGTFLSQAIAGFCHPGRDKILFIDPTFAVYRTQVKFLGLKEASVDIYDRGNWLKNVEQLCAAGDIGGILFASPNNPAWLIFTEEELKELGRICTQYDVVAIEDAAYFAMDSRVDYSIPGQPPFPPTIGRHTDNYVIVLSSSKIFSYAGQRIALTAISPKLAKREYDGLEKRYGYRTFFDAFVWGALYGITSGVAQSPQHGLTALLSKANRGDYNFLRATSVYAERAKELKAIMRKYGFQLVYADDLGEPLSDGFYFTVSYPGLTGGQLLRELLYYGISVTTLTISSSTRSEGVRICTSLVPKEDFKLFEKRIIAFRNDHPIAGAEAAEAVETPV
ncbi:MAG: pyridoxal phosphate-dependent aminotransferase [Pseudomonadota bacterium]